MSRSPRDALGPSFDSLVGLVEGSRHLFVLTGAGCSTESGIPDYRDRDGRWKTRPPVSYLDFVRRASVRRRYWARSFAGWPRVAEARPNAAHRALAALEARGRVHHLVTQNVDGLHQQAGSRQVLDLHGRIDAVDCLGCKGRLPRQEVQRLLHLANPSWIPPLADAAPDGDAHLEPGIDGFEVPPCPRCQGLLKPAVVFFGESVPRSRVEAAYARLREADALLVVGSSLMVFSGYRFVRAALERGLPVAAINLGRTGADDRLHVKVEAPSATALPALVDNVS